MDDSSDQPITFGRIIVGFTRIWLPLLIAALGIALIVAGHGSYSELVNTHSLESATGVSLLIVAVIVWMLNWLYRLGASSEHDRDEEERARQYFDATGHWPEDDDD